jgi:hypothetical protein
VNGADDVYVERKGRIERAEGLLAQMRYSGDRDRLHEAEELVRQLAWGPSGPANQEPPAEKVRGDERKSTSGKDYRSVRSFNPGTIRRPRILREARGRSRTRGGPLSRQRGACP